MAHTPKFIQQQIDYLIASLLELGVCDDQNATILRPTSRTGVEVTFANAAEI